MDNQYMKLAIEMAKKTVGQTSPNPVVGCVIVKNREIVGIGVHLKAGDLHAERHAIEMAKDNAKGATMYVTLEPCSHFGRTSPCADAVIEAGIEKVFIASTDPNPEVAGNGIKKLKDAGIKVEVGIMQKQADELNQIFYHYVTTKTPYVTLKIASSIDGKIATTSGESQWITGVEAREDVHHLRHEHDAILVGIETVLHDRPSLTTRLEGGGNNPIRVVLDRRLRIPLDAKLITDQQAPTWIFTTTLADNQKKQEIEKAGAKVFVLNSEDISIDELLSILGNKQISSLLVEGGGTVNDSFLRIGKFQRLIKYMAPIVIGGGGARSSFSGEGIALLSEAPKLLLQSMEQIGDDVKFVYVKEGEY